MSTAVEDTGHERLQKVLAQAGVASRRASEELIKAGRVKVNGETVVALGTKVHPVDDEIMVDNRIVVLDKSKKYVLLNKPAGVVSTLDDEKGRPDLSTFTKRYSERLFNVGRLDAETTGLLLLTNDGELAHVLSHPSFEVQKTYIARVAGKLKNSHAQQLLDGVELEDGMIRADRARKLPGGDGNTSMIEVTLHSGRNRIVRRMLQEIGFPVVELARLHFGPLSLGTLKIGQMRELDEEEISHLLSRVKKAERRRNAKTSRAYLEDERFRKPRPPKQAKPAGRKKSTNTAAAPQGKQQPKRHTERKRHDS